ncbi:MAG TPA: CoA transferase [Dehalococcoidia bacterium]|nr:CoA transferase [Dehalococcoidia bacterium]
MENSISNNTALGDLRVLDLTGPIGLYCTKQLADLGAEVIKIEQPGGDPVRRIGPFYHDEIDPEKSLYWFHFNTSKKSITLNLQSIEGVEIMKRLVKTADVLVETYQPGYLDSMGLGYSILKEINPGLIMTSITPFGQTGPYKDFKASDLIGLAMGGFLFICGWEDEPPTRVGGSQAYNMASINACIATLTALYYRDMTGEGQYIDVSMQQCVAHALQWVTQMYDLQGRIMARSGRLGVPLQECKDGWANMIALFDWDIFVEWLDSVGEASDLSDAKYKQMDYQIRPEVRQHITEVTDAFTKAHDKRWLCEEGQKRHIIAIPCNNARDVVENPQLVERSFFVNVEHPELQDTLMYPGAPYRLGETPWRIARRAPLIGEHNTDIYIEELGFTSDDLEVFKERGII